MKKCKWCKTDISHRGSQSLYCSRKCGENFKRGSEPKPRRKPLDDDTARAELLSYGLEMIGSYIGTVHKNQPCRCLTCSSENNPRIASLRMGQGGCKTCGLAAGASKRRLTDEEARQKFLKYGFKIIGEYVGKVDSPQLCECLKCGNQTSPRISNLERRNTGGCKFCARNVPLNEEGARKELLQHGMRMVGSYVGTVRNPQHCQCLVCHGFISPTISTLRQGGGCLHCARAALPGEYNKTTIKRRPDRWNHLVNVYLRTVEFNGKTWTKIGIGTEQRANEGPGQVLLLFLIPLALAYFIETETLQKTRRSPVSTEEWPPNLGGRTEVVASVEDAWIILNRWKSILPDIQEEPEATIQLVEKWLKLDSSEYNI